MKVAVNKELLGQDGSEYYRSLLGQAESLNVAVATGILLYGLTLK